MGVKSKLHISTKNQFYSVPSNNTFLPQRTGSASDRAAMERAANLGCVGYRSTLQPTNVTIDMVVPAVQLAQNFTLILEVKNTSTEQQTVQLTTTCSVTYYTGVSNGTFKEDRQTVSLGPSRSEQGICFLLNVVDTYVYKSCNGYLSLDVMRWEKCIFIK